MNAFRAVGAHCRVFVVTLCVALATACAVNPVTGERELALISESQEVQMGRQASREVESALGFVDDESLQNYVSTIGHSLADDSERPDLPWEFHVVDDPTPNAFALPGGFIYVTRGLMNLIGSEAELAAVLGHEIGHVTARHSVSQVSRAQLAQVAVGLGAAVAPELLGRFGQLTDLGLNLLFLKYGRDDERQADELGFEYMLDERYDVGEMEHVFESLQAAGELHGASPVPTWLASHPGESERIATAHERAAALPTAATADLRVRSVEYLAQIDGLTYGDDPRDGYFDGNTFYHPELAFQFDVPQGWDRRNLPSAVVAQSPAGDAALQLTLADSGDLRALTAKFSQQQDVEVVTSTETTVNGKAAIVSQFRARANAGTVVGIVAHVANSDRAAFRVVTYATSNAARGYENTFRGVIQSVAALSDSEILAVQPLRMEIVEIDSDMTLEQFERQFPSKVSLDELAVINHVDGANSVLDAASGVKRIV